ncbi:hypothetical protein LTR53_000070 [Teratosphaeriaceae sp. CCFEE 6253]|nr:hypothetical protein LTR53_000070 [Teratosphaeriaceae sp. CCFEE 6253]
MVHPFTRPHLLPPNTARAPANHTVRILARPPPTLADVTEDLIQHHMVRELTEAEACFAAADHAACRRLCHGILQTRAAEAVQAKAHMLMARVCAEGGETRALHWRWHKEEAVRYWETVIERRGESRFPIERAEELLAETLTL